MKRAFALLVLCAASSSVIPAERPNILFIFSDDQRANTIHALGNERIQTPNLDKLVQRDTSFNPLFAWAACKARCARLRARR